MPGTIRRTVRFASWSMRRFMMLRRRSNLWRFLLDTFWYPFRRAW